MHAVVVSLVNGLVLKTLEDPMDYKDVERPEKWKKSLLDSKLNSYGPLG